MALKIGVQVVEDEVTRGLPQLRTALGTALKRTLENTAKATEGTAKLSLISGSRSGRTYKRGKKRPHIASAPGEPPASDFGDLLGHITHTIGKGHADVGATVLHGLHLEIKAPSKGGRPWLLPAFEKHAPGIEGVLVTAIGRQVRR